MTDNPRMEFAELVPFLERWALATENERSEARWRASADDFQSFYDALLPRLDDLLLYVDCYELGALPAEALPFFRLLLAFAEAAPHCELYGGSNRVPNSFTASRFVAAHGPVVET